MRHNQARVLPLVRNDTMFFNNKFNTFFGLNLTLVYTFPMCMTWRFHFPIRNYDFKVSLQKGGIAFGFDAAVEDAIISKETDFTIDGFVGCKPL